MAVRTIVRSRNPDVRSEPFEGSTRPQRSTAGRLLGLTIRLRAEVTVVIVGLTAWVLLTDHLPHWAAVTLIGIVIVTVGAVGPSRRYVVFDGDRGVDPASAACGLHRTTDHELHRKPSDLGVVATDTGSARGLGAAARWDRPCRFRAQPRLSRLRVRGPLGPRRRGPLVHRARPDRHCPARSAGHPDDRSPRRSRLGPLGGCGPPLRVLAGGQKGA